MELTADQDRLVRAGARFAGVEPEDFLGECIRMGFDAADGATWRTDDAVTRMIEGSKQNSAAANVTVAEAVQQWERTKDDARKRAGTNGSSGSWVTRPDGSPAPRTTEEPEDEDQADEDGPGVLTKESTLDEIAEALMDALRGHKRRKVLTKTEVAEMIGFTTESGLARTIGRAMGAKFTALGIGEVERGGVKGHEVGVMVDRAREHFNGSD